MVYLLHYFRNMRLPIILLLNFFFITATAQRAGIFHSEEIKTMEDAWGRPIRPQTTYKVEGTPFFPHNYTRSRIFFDNGKYNSNVVARINLYDNTVLYQDAEMNDMQLVIPVRTIEFIDSISGEPTVFARYSGVEGLNESIFYQVIDTGKVILLKHIFVTYRDFAPYGSGVITRTFAQKNALYLLKDGIAIKCSKQNSEWSSIMADHDAAVKGFIESENIKTKTEEGLRSIVRYYNNL